MIISNFTKPELDLLRDNCNFVGCEKELFDLRSQGVPLEAIAEALNMTIDGTKRISRKVNDKITRIMHF